MHVDVVTALLYCLRALSAGAGLLLLYAAFFLYEDEQQRVQSTIEALWIRIDELRTTSEKAAAFFQAVAGIGVRVIDRIFGPSSLSLQSFAVSSYLLTASSNLLAPFVLTGHLPTNFSEDWGERFWAPMLLGFLPALFQKRWAVWVSGIPFILGCAFMIGITGYDLLQGASFYGELRFLKAIGAPDAAALFLTILAVAVDRVILKWWCRRPTLSAAALVALLNAAFLTLATGPWLFSSHSSSGSQHSPTFLEDMSASMLFPALIAALIVIVMGVTVLHRVLWPLMARPLYALAQHGVVRQSKLLGSLGFGLLAFGIGNRQWLVSLGKTVGLN